MEKEWFIYRPGSMKEVFSSMQGPYTEAVAAAKRTILGEKEWQTISTDELTEIDAGLSKLRGSYPFSF